MKIFLQLFVFILIAVFINNIEGGIYKRDASEIEFVDDREVYHTAKEDDISKEKPTEERKFNFFDELTGRSRRFFNDLMGRNAGVEREETAKWTTALKDEMKNVFNSLSNMWETTVNKLQDWSSIQDNQMWSSISSSLKNMENDLMSIWDSSVKFVSIDNKTKVPLDSELIQGENNINRLREFIEDRSKQVSQTMTNVFDKLNEKDNTGSYVWMPKLNISHVDDYVLQMQSYVNNAWQKLADKIQNKTANISIDMPDVIKNEVDRLKRMQRDVDQMWTNVWQANKTENPHEHKFKTVITNLKNFYTEKGNGSMVDGVMKSAQERIKKIGEYFQSIFSSSRREMETQMDKVEKMINEISKRIGALVDVFKNKSKTTPTPNIIPTPGPEINVPEIEFPTDDDKVINDEIEREELSKI